MADRGSFSSSYSNSQTNARPAGPGMSHDFQRLTQAISSNIQKLNANVSQMQTWLGMYGTKAETPELCDKFDELQHRTNQLAKDTNAAAKDLSQLPLSSNPTEQRQQKLQKERLVEEFTRALSNFQKVQREKKERDRTKPVQAPARGGGGPTGGGSATVAYDPFADSKPTPFQYGEDYSYSGPKQQTTIQMDSQEMDMQIIRERDEALRKLESDIMDVNQIFRDLGTLVHEQGDMIDSIEANVDSASVSVEQANEQLRQARTYQSSARKKKCCIIMIVVIVLAIIIIILAVTLTRK